MSAATIRVRIPSGAVRSFEASTVTVRRGFVTADGRWANAPRTAGRFTWPAWRVLEVRHEAVISDAV